MRKAIFIHSSEFDRYVYPDGCPFDTRRAGLTEQTVRSMGLLGVSGQDEVAPVAATRAEMEKYHLPGYLDVLEAAGAGSLDEKGLAMGLGTPDCPVFTGMHIYTALASGASITGARQLLSGAADIAFNPSGGYHHAFPDRAGGFCYINDIVLAAMTLVEAGRRVMVIDLDVHHCDGVQHAFYARNDVMVLSMHESGHTLFPGTGFEDEIGTGPGRGYTINLPLPVGTHDAIYLSAFREVVLPLAEAYAPDALIVEIGMDTLAGDPLAHLHLTNNVYPEIIEALLKFNKPVLFTGGGGYNVENTVRGWSLAWSVMCGEYIEDMSIGMGGVMLENRDWFGGLRDRVLLSDAGMRNDVDAQVRVSIDKLRATVFPMHGIGK